MSDMWVVFKEQISSLNVIKRLSKYNEKSTYQSHYLGMLWQVLKPAFDIMIYYFIFGKIVNGGREVDGQPYIVWMLVGYIAWFFMRTTIINQSNSVVAKVRMVSRMKFPLSTLPSMSIFSNLFNYGWMMGIMLVIFIIFGIYPTVYWLQYIYYFICMIAFLYGLGLITSTLTVIARDFHILVNTILTALFYFSGAILNFSNLKFMKENPLYLRIIELNPFYYINEGFRDAFLSRGWFFKDISGAVIFWCITFLFIMIGSHIHLKFRSRFVDYV